MAIKTEAQKQDEEEDPLSLLKILSDQEYIKNLLDESAFRLVTLRYPFVSTLYYFNLAEQTLNDPIMQQLCPTLKELTNYHGDMDDPLAEEADSPVKGLVHRYPDRVLFILTNVCFMNCRHCTRKRLWQEGRFARTKDEIDAMLAYVRENKQVRDVILSGGDPLTLTDEVLEYVLANLRAIAHVEIIRIGTRAPVVYPFRITSSLVAVLKKHKPLWVSTQFNHAKEITPASAQAVTKILEAGIPVNNQTVLLKGINDDVQTMTDLSHGLLKIGVRPYYLFHCDPVTGVGHFRTSISKGMEIIDGMRGHTSGLAVPAYVVDAVGGGGKIPLQPDYLKKREGDTFILRNYENKEFLYSDVCGEVI